MYRDDVCAVCGESLPPDHFYCREHAAEVDDRLHEIGERLGSLRADARRLAELLEQIAPETWDWLAEQAAGAGGADDEDPVWPPSPPLTLHAHADEVDVDVDTEPGRVRVDLALALPTLLGALSEGLERAQVQRVAETCAQAEGAGATH